MAEASMHIATGVRVRDTILWVEDTGQANLPVVLCLHSLFVDGAMYDGLVKAASGRFRMIRPDFRGQGRSAPPTEPLISMECCAEDILDLIVALRLPPVHLVAASMGGDVAIRMVARRPERFRSLVMMGSSVRSEPDEQKATFTQLLARTEESGFAGDDLEMLMMIMFGATTRSDARNQAMLDHWRNKMGSLPRSSWPAMAGVLHRSSAVDLLPQVTAPTLIFSGTEDIGRPIDWAKDLAHGIVNSEWVVLERVGHTPLLEVPDLVIPATLDFWNKVP